MAGLGDLLGLMRNMGGMKRKVEEAQGALAQQTVEGSAGGPGAPGVVATVNGMQELVDLVIAPEVVNRDQVDLLEDLVRAAVGQAMAKARDLQKQEMSKLLGGLPLPPGLDGLLG